MADIWGRTFPRFLLESARLQNQAMMRVCGKLEKVCRHEEVAGKGETQYLESIYGKPAEQGGFEADEEDDCLFKGESPVLF